MGSVDGGDELVRSELALLAASIKNGQDVNHAAGLLPGSFDYQVHAEFLARVRGRRHVLGPHFTYRNNLELRSFGELSEFGAQYLAEAIGKSLGAGIRTCDGEGQHGHLLLFREPGAGLDMTQGLTCVTATHASIAKSITAPMANALRRLIRPARTGSGLTSHDLDSCTDRRSRNSSAASG